MFTPGLWSFPSLLHPEVTEAEKRQASQLREAEDRAAHVEKEAQLRAEDTKQAAAVILEKQVAELQLWLSQAEDEMLRTQDRLEIEQAKAQKLIGNVHAMAENFQQRGELCRQRAEEMVVETGEEVAKMIEEYRQWRVEEMEYVACQVWPARWHVGHSSNIPPTPVHGKRRWSL